MQALVLAAVGALALAPLCHAQPAVTVPAPGLSPPITQLVDANLARDLSTLQSAAKQNDRDDAARRLVARQSQQGREIIAAAVRGRDPLAQLAAVKALADDSSPDPGLIGPLADLLSTERLTEACTAALLNYHQDEAIDRLRRFVSEPRNPRTTAISALGLSSDVRVARILIDLVQGNDPIRANFAADALVKMTLLPENGRDRARWLAWWRVNAVKTPEQFRAELLERTRRRRPALTDVDALVYELYKLTAEDKKADALRRILDSGDPIFRAAGAKMTYQILNSDRRLPAGTLERLREMLRDSAPEVRAEVGRVLLKFNDRPALDQVVAQLRIDPDAEARIALIQAVVPMTDGPAVGKVLPELIRILADPSTRIATVAAETIAKLGPIIRQDPQLTRDVIAALSAVYQTRGPQDEQGNLRAACLEALVKLGDLNQRDLFLNSLDPKLPGRIRVAALAGLGAIRSVNDVDMIFRIAQSNTERDNSVRAAAIESLEQIGAAGFVQQLLNISRAPNEDEAVKRAAWHAFESFLPRASDEQLLGWAKMLLDAGERLPRTSVLKERVARLRQAQPPRTQELAADLLSLGEDYVKGGQPQQGIPNLQESLGIWEKSNPDGQAAATARRSLLEAYLAAKLYPEVVRFAQDSITASAKREEDFLPVLIRTIEDLSKSSQKSDALRLANEALKLHGIRENNRNLLTRRRDEAASPTPGNR